jgi:hypothetical protein
MASEKGGKTIITIARVATADQMRALASGEAVFFTSGKSTFSVTHDKAEPLYAAQIPSEGVAQTGEIWHLVGDSIPAYQNVTLEQVLTRQLIPVKIDPTDLRDGSFYALELVDPTGKKTDYVPVHYGGDVHKTANKPLVRIMPQKGAGSTIDLPPTNLELGAVQGFLQSLAGEKEVTFAAHNKTKEEKDLEILVKDDSHEIMERLGPFMVAANLKPGGSSAVFHLFQSILQKIGSPPILICGDKDLVTCSDIHSLPVEVCVLTILYPLLEEHTEQETRDALRSSISLDGEEQQAKVEAALETLSFSVQDGSWKKRKVIRS